VNTIPFKRKIIGGNAMYVIVCCNGYYTVGTTKTPEEAVKIARNHKDGSYASIIIENGKGVDGMKRIPHGSPPPYDHATATGMYDRY
jgi:hypothetical protein